MRTVILKNPEKTETESGKIIENKGNILNYRIEEAKLDQNGEPFTDKETGRLAWTGTTLEWTLKVGETAEFPGYVADYLLQIYPFLQIVKPEESKKEEMVQRPGEKTGEFICKYCHQSFKKQRDLGLHIGLKHTSEIT